MHTSTRRAAVGLVAVGLVVSLAACGSAKEAKDGDGDLGSGKKDGPLSVALLLPEDQTARYENFDKPLIEKRIKELCAECTVTYSNAKGSAATQQQQMNSMITKKVDVIILDAVNYKSIASSVSKAENAGVPVVAYDRLAEGPISGYASFDNVKVGKVQGEALLEALGDRADQGQIVMMNGSPTDPNAAQFKEGAMSVLKDKVKVGRSYDTTEWKASEANKNMSGAIASLGKENIVGVYSANDNMAGGIITAMEQANFDELPPVTGQDAELSGVQRILQKRQYMSIYKPFKPATEAVAEMALAVARGEKPSASTTVDSGTHQDIPATLLTPVALTVDNIEETLIKDGLYTVDQICTKKYRSACQEAGLLD